MARQESRYAYYYRLSTEANDQIHVAYYNEGSLDVAIKHFDEEQERHRSTSLLHQVPIAIVDRDAETRIQRFHRVDLENLAELLESLAPEKLPYMPEEP